MALGPTSPAPRLAAEKWSFPGDCGVGLLGRLEPPLGEIEAAFLKGGLWLEEGWEEGKAL